MKKFGGPNKIRQKCRLRQCQLRARVSMDRAGQGQVGVPGWEVRVGLFETRNGELRWMKPEFIWREGA